MEAADRTPLVAQVAVDVSLPHLDRVFDYSVPEPLRAEIAVGCRVRVRFAGKLADGFVLGLSTESDAGAKLRPLERVISSESVLTGPIASLCRAVADHYGGTFADVVRMAVPTRHATAEKGRPIAFAAPRDAGASGVLASYPDGERLLASLGAGRPVRVSWTPVAVQAPPGDWRAGFLDAAGAVLAAGKRALLVVPDASDVAALAAAADARFGSGSHVALSADLGPAARYRAFLAALRGEVSLVIGTRNAAYAPVPDLGLIALWDEGNDSYAEPRAPYPHAREIVALRAAQQRVALMVAGYARTAETQALVERGWLAPLQLSPAEARRLGPAVRVAVDSDVALERDAAAKAARLPHEVFGVIRTGLAQGPVLIQVPRAGYVAAAACGQCRTPARCPTCRGPLRGERGASDLRLVCTSCGPVNGWHCPECGDTRLRTPRVGVKRTAEELGKAFVQTRVIESWSGHLVDAVGAAPCLVLATPGAEPRASEGYAAAVLLDTWQLLNRADLRAGEEALRRWLAVCAQTRGGASGGTVCAVGESDARALQALVRLDPVGFAERELADRGAAGFPPTARLVTVEGSRSAIDSYQAAAASVAGVESFGPVSLDEETWRLTLRTTPKQGSALIASLRHETSRRSLAKESAVRVRVDPHVIQ